MTSHERIITLFDIDNTLVRGFSIFHFADFLQTKGIFPSDVRQRMQGDYDVFVQGQSDYRNFAIDVVGNFYIGLEGAREEQVIAAGEDFMPQYRTHLLPYSSQLVAMMNAVGVTIAISGAPKEAFDPLGKTLGIDISRSSLLEGEIMNGFYTGKTKVNRALDNEKIRAIENCAEDFDFDHSFAFGDSMHDLPTLEAVGNPFVVIEDEELVRYATDKGWPRVDEHTILNTVKQKLTRLGLV